MSLLKYLSEIKKEKSGEDIALIEKIQSEQRKGYGGINLQEIKADVERLSAVIDSFNEDVSTRHVFFSLVQKIFFETFLTYEGSGKEFFHPSSLYEDCSRKLYYDLTETPYSDSRNKKITPELQMVFDVGTIYHCYIQYLVKRTGMDAEIEASINSRRYRVNGKGDIVITAANGDKYLIEIKTTAGFSFSKAVNRPIKKHVRQATVYAKLCGAKKIIFLYINKDDQRMVSHSIDVADEVWGEMSSKMVGVLGAVNKKVAPKRECKSIADKMAINCPYATECFKNSKD